MDRNFKLLINWSGFKDPESIVLLLIVQAWINRAIEIPHVRTNITKTSMELFQGPKNTFYVRPIQDVSVVVVYHCTIIYELVSLGELKLFCRLDKDSSCVIKLDTHLLLHGTYPSSNRG